jgi:hypothetical protein
MDGWSTRLQSNAALRSGALSDRPSHVDSLTVPTPAASSKGRVLVAAQHPLARKLFALPPWYRAKMFHAKTSMATSTQSKSTRLPASSRMVAPAVYAELPQVRGKKTLVLTFSFPSLGGAFYRVYYTSESGMVDRVGWVQSLFLERGAGMVSAASLVTETTPRAALWIDGIVRAGKRMFGAASYATNLSNWVVDASNHDRRAWLSVPEPDLRTVLRDVSHLHYEQVGFFAPYVPLADAQALFVTSFNNALVAWERLTLQSDIEWRNGSGFAQILLGQTRFTALKSEASWNVTADGKNKLTDSVRNLFVYPEMIEKYAFDARANTNKRLAAAFMLASVQGQVPENVESWRRAVAASDDKSRADTSQSAMYMSILMWTWMVGARIPDVWSDTHAHLLSSMIHAPAVLLPSYTYEDSKTTWAFETKSSAMLVPMEEKLLEPMKRLVAWRRIMKRPTAAWSSSAWEGAWRDTARSLGHRMGIRPDVLDHAQWNELFRKGTEVAAGWFNASTIRASSVVTATEEDAKAFAAQGDVKVQGVSVQVSHQQLQPYLTVAVWSYWAWQTWLMGAPPSSLGITPFVDVEAMLNSDVKVKARWTNWLWTPRRVSAEIVHQGMCAGITDPNMKARVSQTWDGAAQRYARNYPSIGLRKWWLLPQTSTLTASKLSSMSRTLEDSASASLSTGFSAGKRAMEVAQRALTFWIPRSKPPTRGSVEDVKTTQFYRERLADDRKDAANIQKVQGIIEAKVQKQIDDVSAGAESRASVSDPFKKKRYAYCTRLLTVEGEAEGQQQYRACSVKLPFVDQTADTETEVKHEVPVVWAMYGVTQAAIKKVESTHLQSGMRDRFRVARSQLALPNPGSHWTGPQKREFFINPMDRWKMVCGTEDWTPASWRSHPNVLDRPASRTAISQIWATQRHSNCWYELYMVTPEHVWTTLTPDFVPKSKQRIDEDWLLKAFAFASVLRDRHSSTMDALSINVEMMLRDVPSAQNKVVASKLDAMWSREDGSLRMDTLAILMLGQFIQDRRSMPATFDTSGDILASMDRWTDVVSRSTKFMDEMERLLSDLRTFQLEDDDDGAASPPSTAEAEAEPRPSALASEMNRLKQMQHVMSTIISADADQRYAPNVMMRVSALSAQVYRDLDVIFASTSKDTPVASIPVMNDMEDWVDTKEMSIHQLKEVVRHCMIWWNTVLYVQDPNVSASWEFTRKLTTHLKSEDDDATGVSPPSTPTTGGDASKGVLASVVDWIQRQIPSAIKAAWATFKRAVVASFAFLQSILDWILSHRYILMMMNLALCAVLAFVRNDYHVLAVVMEVGFTGVQMVEDVITVLGDTLGGEGAGAQWLQSLTALLKSIINALGGILFNETPASEEEEDAESEGGESKSGGVWGTMKTVVTYALTLANMCNWWVVGTITLASFLYSMIRASVKRMQAYAASFAASPLNHWNARALGMYLHAAANMGVRREALVDLWANGIVPVPPQVKTLPRLQRLKSLPAPRMEFHTEMNALEARVEDELGGNVPEFWQCGHESKQVYASAGTLKTLFQDEWKTQQDRALNLIRQSRTMRKLDELKQLIQQMPRASKVGAKEGNTATTEGAVDIAAGEGLSQGTGAGGIGDAPVVHAKACHMLAQWVLDLPSSDWFDLIRDRAIQMEPDREDKTSAETVYVRAKNLWSVPVQNSTLGQGKTGVLLTVNMQQMWAARGSMDVNVNRVASVWRNATWLEPNRECWDWLLARLDVDPKPKRREYEAAQGIELLLNQRSRMQKYAMHHALQQYDAKLADDRRVDVWGSMLRGGVQRVVATTLTGPECIATEGWADQSFLMSRAVGRFMSDRYGKLSTYTRMLSNGWREGTDAAHALLSSLTSGNTLDKVNKWHRRLGVSQVSTSTSSSEGAPAASSTASALKEGWAFSDLSEVRAPSVSGGAPFGVSSTTYTKDMDGAERVGGGGSGFSLWMFKSANKLTKSYDPASRWTLPWTKAIQKRVRTVISTSSVAAAGADDVAAAGVDTKFLQRIVGQVVGAAWDAFKALLTNTIQLLLPIVGEAAIVMTYMLCGLAGTAAFVAAETVSGLAHMLMALTGLLVGNLLVQASKYMVIVMDWILDTVIWVVQVLLTAVGLLGALCTTIRFISIMTSWAVAVWQGKLSVMEFLMIVLHSKELMRMLKSILPEFLVNQLEKAAKPTAETLFKLSKLVEWVWVLVLGVLTVGSALGFLQSSVIADLMQNGDALPGWTKSLRVHMPKCALQSPAASTVGGGGGNVEP